MHCNFCTVEGSDYVDIRKTMKKQYPSYPLMNADKNHVEEMKNMLPREFNPKWVPPGKTNKNLTTLKDKKFDNTEYIRIIQNYRGDGKNERKNIDIPPYNDCRNVMMQKYLQKSHKVSPVEIEVNDKKDFQKSMKKYRSEANLHKIKRDDKNQNKNKKDIGSEERKYSNITPLSTPRHGCGSGGSIFYNEVRKMMQKYRSLPKFELVVQANNIDEDRNPLDEKIEQNNLALNTASNSPSKMIKQNHIYKEEQMLEHELANIAVVFKEVDNVIKEMLKE